MGGSLDGMSEFFRLMVDVAEAPSGLLAGGFGHAIEPFPFPSVDDDALLAQAQRESLLEAWRASLPVSFHDAERGGCQGGSECPLCLAEFYQGDRVMHLDCLHFFHVDCITPWIATKSSCPLC